MWWGLLESSGCISVACAWECCVGPQQVLFLVVHVGGRAGPGSVPRSGSLLCGRIIMSSRLLPWGSFEGRVQLLCSEPISQVWLNIFMLIIDAFNGES